MDRSPASLGFIIGLVSFAGGVALTWTVLALQFLWGLQPDHLLLRLGAVSGGRIDDAARVYYSSQFVGMSRETDGMVFGDNMRFLPDPVVEPTVLLFYLIPVGTLLLAGFSLRYYARPAGSAPLRSAAICAGYGFAATVGIFIFRGRSLHDVFGPEYLMWPNVGFTILSMVLVYPILFGTIGGYLGTRYKTKRPGWGTPSIEVPWGER